LLKCSGEHLFAEGKTMKLSGKTAIITGAADGIGLCIAKYFVAQGATVVMGDINAQKCEAEAATLRAAGHNATAIACDVTSTAQVETLVSAAAKQGGRVDILVNNAAIAVPGNVATMPEEDWQRVLNTNLTSAFRTIKAVIPHMLRQRSGSVINIASGQAHRSWENWTAYAAAKGGLLSMTQQLAGQFGAHNIRFNSVSPGTINTPMNERRVASEGAAMVRSWEMMHALERIGQPEEVAAAVLFLACDDSTFITGHELAVDGGMSVLPRYVPPAI
jgi:meso-butanediol dehydrogenase / (S,S)-butanediol dehydrogenase / diacetyl reductase